MNNRETKSSTLRNSPDDWETDPDFVRDMDEMDQRWGSKRTVGSINMNELIDQVRKDHKILREKLDHPSQRDHSEGFGGKFGVQRDRKDASAHDYDYLEKLSKHTSQEISREVITSTSLSGGVEDAKRSFLEKTEKTIQKKRSSPIGTNYSDDRSSADFRTSDSNLRAKASPKVEETSANRRIITEETSTSSAKRSPEKSAEIFKSIQEKIDAFKKEFDDVQSRVAKKSDISKVIKKTTNLEKSNNSEYVSRFESKSPSTGSQPFSNFSASREELPKSSIKSLSEKFETLCREDGEDFRRRTEAKRKEFFNQIKSQVRETRRELDGFDSIDNDEAYDKIERKLREKTEKSSPAATKQFSPSPTFAPSPSSRPSSRVSDDSQFGKAKVYTRRETTQEEFVSKIVKENDKIVENETKRNVQKSSSVHGSSDEDEPTSIRSLNEKLKSSPVQRTESPVDKMKREIPIVTPEIKGAGLMARTLFDYQATEDDELSFDVDDLITNIEKIDSGWYMGTITYKDGRKCKGLFPANYVKLLNDTSEY